MTDGVSDRTSYVGTETRPAIAGRACRRSAGVARERAWAFMVASANASRSLQGPLQRQLRVASQQMCHTQSPIAETRLLRGDRRVLAEGLFVVGTVDEFLGDQAELDVARG